MGSLRTLLALTVLLTHSYGGLVLVGGQNAVRLFYLISGFLISYVLTEARSYNDLRSFYVNRFLRLYPIYATVAAATLIFYVAIGQQAFFDVYRDSPASARAMLALTNVVLFGQDWVMFTAIEHGRLVLSADFWRSDIPLYEGLLAPQAWTLGVEMSFYLVAPFILPRRKWLLAAFVASLAIRLVLLRKGLGWNDPWNYRFFPSELCLFLAGSLAHQHLLPLYKRIGRDGLQAAAKGATAFLIALVLVYPLLPLSELAKMALLFPAFAIAMPLAFVFQSHSKLDRWIGEFSYPVYIGHMLVFSAVTALCAHLRIGSKVTIATAAVLGSLALAYLLNASVGRVVERIRRRVREQRPPMVTLNREVSA